MFNYSSNNLAPVFIITLNRYEHFIACIESLKKCKLSELTDLYIGVDYPTSDEHYFGYMKILEYVEGLKAFKNVIVLKREINFGIMKNFFSGVEIIFRKFDKIIFTEDDNIFAEDFLIFMNYSLNTYENNPQVFTISGYNYPVKMPDNYNSSAFLWSGHSAWGYGLWKSKWEKLNWDEEIVFNTVNKFLMNFRLAFKLNKVANHYLEAMLLMLKMRRINGDGYICLYQFMNGMYSVFPVVSRVRNIGHDGSGYSKSIRHDGLFENQEIYIGPHDYLLQKDITENADVNLALYNYFKRSFFANAKTFFKIIIHYIKNIFL